MTAGRNPDPHRRLRRLVNSTAGEEKRVADGLLRTVTPDVTIARMRPHMAEMGITRIANVTGLDRIGIPVVMVCRPNARSLSVSQGKGMTLDAATASGLMESIELFHAEHIDLPLKLASYRQMRRDHALANIERLPRVAPGRFDTDRDILWIKSLELISQTPRWLPFECVHTNFTLPPAPMAGCFDSSSNGLASGNTFGEAVCHAICEVIERDATALWNRLAMTQQGRLGLDLTSVEDDHCLRLLHQFRDAEFEVAVWDTTSDTAVASFYCLLADRRDPQGHCGIGAGTHLSPHIALARALTEAAQVRTTYISGTRDDLLPDDYGDAERHRKAKLAGLMLKKHQPASSFSNLTDQATDNFSTDLSVLIDQLSKAGIREILACDLSKQQFQVPVVRVVIPGLEGPDDHGAYLPGERARRLVGTL